VKTDKTIHDIGLPTDVVNRLIGNKTVSPLEILRSYEKVEVMFLRNYCRLYKEGEIRKISRIAYNNLLRKNHVRLLSEPLLEPINVEL